MNLQPSEKELYYLQDLFLQDAKAYIYIDQNDVRKMELISPSGKKMVYYGATLYELLQKASICIRERVKGDLTPKGEKTYDSALDWLLLKGFQFKISKLDNSLKLNISEHENSSSQVFSTQYTCLNLLYVLKEAEVWADKIKKHTDTIQNETDINHIA